MGLDTFSYIQLAVGGYLLWCGITRSGKLFETKKLKCPRKKYVRVMGNLAAFTAVCMMLEPLLTMTKVILPGSPVSWILWAIGFGGIVAMAVFNKKMVANNPGSSAQGTSTRPAPVPEHLRSAFEFDEADKPQSEKKENNSENK
jgi:hypothetical protein